MIVYKKFTKVVDGKTAHSDGWFLFGVVPLYKRSLTATAKKEIK